MRKDVTDYDDLRPDLIIRLNYQTNYQIDPLDF